jgi:uncharacterized protein
LKRETAIALLKKNQAHLNELGVRSVSVIGSTAREEATALSDVDLAVTLTPGERGFPHLERMEQLRQRFSEILGVAVDVIEEPAPSRRIQDAIDQDRVRAF